MTAKLAETIPALPVVDVRRALDFYVGRLGFDEVFASDDYAIVRRDGAEIHLWAANDESWQSDLDRGQPVCSGAETFLAGTASCRIRVEGIDDLYEHCRAERLVHPNAPLREKPWNTREFAITDADNNLVTFFEP